MTPLDTPSNEADQSPPHAPREERDAVPRDTAIDPPEPEPQPESQAESDIYALAAQLGDAPEASSWQHLSEEQRQRLSAMRDALQLLNRAGPRRPVNLLQPGGQLGRHQILKILGRGGMGVVYEAWDERLGRRVALKLLDPAVAGEPKRRERFRSEGQYLAKLQHPNIVQVYEIGDNGGPAGDQLFLSMEFVDGPTLHALVGEQPLAADRVAAIVEQVARAVEHAHQNGVVHRDLKPGNVLVAGDVPKVADFGLAAPLEGARDLTRTGDLIGTPSYMAPEMIDGGRAAGGRPAPSGALIDVYGIGTILYEALTARAPFVGANPVLVLSQVQWLAPIPPRTLQPEIPVDLETICLKCLAKEPARRYASAKDLADDLGRFRRGEPIVARPAGRIEKAWRWCRRNRLVAGLAASIAVLLVGASLGATAFAFREQQRAADAIASQKAEEKLRKEAEDARAAADKSRKEAEDARIRAQKSAALASDSLAEISDVFFEQVLSLQYDFPEQKRNYLKRVIDLVDRVSAEKGKDEAWQRKAVLVYQRVGSMRVYMGDTAIGEETAKKGVERAEALVADFPGPVNRRTLAESLFTLGQIYQGQRRLKDAFDASRRGLVVLEALIADDPENPQLAREASISETALGILAFRLKDLDESERLFRSCLERRLKINSEPEKKNYDRQLVGAAHRDLGGLYIDLIRGDDARRHLDEARLIFKKLLAEFPNHPGLQQEMANLEVNDGRHFLKSNDQDKALAHFEAAEAIFHSLLKRFPSNAFYRNDLINCYGFHAISLDAAKRPDDAKEYRRKLMELKK